jgi:hypothetical protein
MALIGLHEGVLTASTRYPCARGYPPLGGQAQNAIRMHHQWICMVLLEHLVTLISPMFLKV